MSELIFYYNGIKDGKGAALQKCSYSSCQLFHYPAGTITIYGRDYSRFSKAVREAFVVQNDSDSMTDYFENDTIRVAPSHPLFAQVKAAHEAQNSKRIRVRNNPVARAA